MIPNQSAEQFEQTSHGLHERCPACGCRPAGESQCIKLNEGETRQGLLDYYYSELWHVRGPEEMPPISQLKELSSHLQG